MKCFAILLLLSSATLSYANPYDLSSNEAELVKQLSSNSLASAKLSQDKTPFSDLPKVETRKAIIATELLERGNLTVTKKICVNGNSGEENTANFNYNVNIGIKVTFI